jgi:hypothetical protein
MKPENASAQRTALLGSNKVPHAFVILLLMYTGWLSESVNFPPLCDPSLWFTLCNTHRAGFSKPGKPRDSWAVAEKRGDPYAATILMRVASDYGLPSKCHTLVREVFTSNFYWQKLVLKEKWHLMFQQYSDEGESKKRSLQRRIEIQSQRKDSGEKAAAILTHDFGSIFEVCSLYLRA